MYIIRMYFYNIGMAWKARIAYPGAFILTVLMQILAYFAQFITTWILISSFVSLKDWTSNEVVFLYGMQLMTYSIGSAFAANTVNDLPDMVKMGQIDELLTKPIHPLIYLLSTKFNVGYLAHFTISLIMMLTSFITSDHSISAIKLLLFIFFTLCGAIITGSTMLITTIPCIYLIGSSGWWGVFYNLKTYTNYPITIFKKSIQILFTCLIPFAFISYYPCRYLFGKVEGVFPNNIINICSPLIAALLVLITYKVWKVSIKKYDGSGS